MPLVLDSSKQLALEISKMEISKVVVNTDGRSAEATYWKEYTAGEQDIRVEDNQLSVSGEDFDKLINRAQEINDSGVGVWDSLKTAVYEKIMQVEGVSGSVE